VRRRVFGRHLATAARVRPPAAGAVARCGWSVQSGGRAARLAANGATPFPTRNNDFPQAEQRRAKVQVFTRKKTLAVVRLQPQLTILHHSPSHRYLPYITASLFRPIANLARAIRGLEHNRGPRHRRVGQSPFYRCSRCARLGGYAMVRSGNRRRGAGNGLGEWLTTAICDASRLHVCRGPATTTPIASGLAPAASRQRGCRDWTSTSPPPPLRLRPPSLCPDLRRPMA
jgi:hypothetical protein